MNAVLEVISSEVPKKGRIFNSKDTFRGWLFTVSGYKRHGMTPAEFYSGFQALVEAGSVAVRDRRGNVIIKVVDRV